MCVGAWVGATGALDTLTSADVLRGERERERVYRCGPKPSILNSNPQSHYNHTHTYTYTYTYLHIYTPATQGMLVFEDSGVYNLNPAP